MRIYELKKQRYAKYAVSDVSPHWLEGVDANAVYPQECFYRAFDYAVLVDRPSSVGIWLVHGACDLAYGPHAWVELPDGLVFDGVLQQFYRIDDWEGKLSGQAWYKFTPSAALMIFANMPETDDGQLIYRWDTALNLPWYDGVTLEIDHEKASELIVARGLREPLPEEV